MYIYTACFISYYIDAREFISSSLSIVASDLFAISKNSHCFEDMMRLL